MHTIPCLRCETPFERKRRGPVVHYCRPCRVERKREYDRAYRRQQDQVIEDLQARLPDEMTVHLDELRGVLGLCEAETLPLAHDRMPAGSKSPVGSDEGRSTYFTDLAGELDTLSREAASHPWWSTEPHWAHDL